MATNAFAVLALVVAGCGLSDQETEVASAVTTELSRTGWTITASPTAGSESNMIDANSSTRWTTGVAMSNGNWIRIDLGATRAFDRIDMDSGSSTGDYARGYAIYVSSDGSTWGTAVASGSGSAQLVSASFASQSKRYVKIVQTGAAGNWWSIHELHMYTTNPALDRTGWVASASVSGESPSRAIDGSSSTRWTTGTAMAPGQWFEVDMLSNRTITGLQLDTSGSSGDYPRGYQVFVSTDGASWGSAVATGTGATITTISFASQTARYLKIVQTGSSGSWWSIHELNVFGSGGGGGGGGGGHIKLVSCNTENQNNASGQAGVLGPLNADVIFLQEINDAAAFRNAMNAYETNVAHSGKVWTVSSSWDSAVMTWRSLSGSYEIHDIGYNSWPDNYNWPANPHRYGIRATVAFNSTPVTFLGTHLDWNPNGDMTNHISNRNNFLSWADGFIAGGGRIIAGGDLNAWTWGPNTTEGNEQRNTISGFASRWTDYCVQLNGESSCNGTPTISSGWTPDHLYHSSGLGNVTYSLVSNAYSDHKIIVVEADVQ